MQTPVEPSQEATEAAIERLARSTESPLRTRACAQGDSLVGCEHYDWYRQLDTDVIAHWQSFTPLARVAMIAMAERLDYLLERDIDRDPS